MFVSPGILEDSADVLLNVNMVEVELAVKNVELMKGKLGCNPYAEENVDDLENVSRCGDHVTWMWWIM